MSKARKPKGETPDPDEGLPSPEHVLEVKEFSSPKGRKYQILKTNETDATDKRGKTSRLNDVMESGLG